MRVIAGSARRTLLDTPEGLGTRPTTDRTKETRFNILNYGLADCRFLDLFAGSGAIGIEALSSGAAEAVFVEQEKAALGCIESNLKKTHLTDKARVLAMEVSGALQYLKADGRPFDIIFMDPPYRMGWPEKILRQLAESPLCTPDTCIVIEEALETDFSFAEEAGCKVQREKKYKTSKHVFLELAGKG